MIDWTIIGKDAYLRTGEHKGKVGKIMVNDQVKYYLRYKGNFESGHEANVIIPSDIPPYVLIIVDNKGNVICVVGAFRQDLSVIGDDNNYEACGRATNSGGSGVTETFHNLPYVKGRVDIEYNMYSVPDMIEVFLVRGEDLELIFTTSRLVSGSGKYSFNYDPDIHPNTLMIRMTGSSRGTVWRYIVNCPVPEEFQ